MLRPAKMDRVLLLLVAVALAGGLSAAELPPEIRVDRLLVQADVQSAEGNAANALASLDAALTLLAEHDLDTPKGFWYRHAKVAAQANEHALAVESATRYLVTVGQEGDDYNRALQLLVASERAVEQDRQAREAAARERDAKQRRRQELDQLDTALKELVRRLPRQGAREDVNGKPYVETTTQFAIDLVGCRLTMEIVRESTGSWSGKLVRAWRRVDADVGRHNRLRTSVEESMVFLDFEDGRSVTYGSNRMDGIGTSDVVGIDAEPSAEATTELVAAFDRIDTLCMQVSGV